MTLLAGGTRRRTRRPVGHIGGAESFCAHFDLDRRDGGPTGDVGFASAASKIFTLLSLEPVARRLPSGLTATQNAGLSWALNSRTDCGLKRRGTAEDAEMAQRTRRRGVRELHESGDDRLAFYILHSALSICLHRHAPTIAPVVNSAIS